MKHHWLFVTFFVAACATDAVNPTGSDTDTDTPDFVLRVGLPNNLPLPDDLGLSSTFSSAGFVDLRNEFFESFGTNGRTCGHCHTPTDGWTVSAENVRLRFDLTFGLDPIFRPVDGTNSPNADVSTEKARRAAYSMLLNRGTIRVGIGVPAGAEFELIAVDDPYGFASADQLSLFRRPLPAANLPLLSTVMWDGRVTGATIDDALGAQADGATLGHAQATQPLSDDVDASIVAFETGLYNAQIDVWRLGPVDRGSADGGAEAIASQALVAAPFDLFDAWQNSPDPNQQAVYRGEVLFNTRTRTTGGGPCNGCHSTQNSGTSFKGSFFSIGQSDAVNRTPDLPLYTFQNIATAETVQTTDPGRALITGLWKDMSKFKVPSLRGLGARPPYFHNGSAQTLLDVVHFYETFGFSFTPSEESDLVAFLSAL